MACTARFCGGRRRANLRRVRFRSESGRRSREQQRHTAHEATAPQPRPSGPSCLVRSSAIQMDLRGVRKIRSLSCMRGFRAARNAFTSTGASNRRALGRVRERIVQVPLSLCRYDPWRRVVAVVQARLLRSSASGPCLTERKAVRTIRALCTTAVFPGSSAVERRTVNPLVVGSSPTRGANKTIT